MRVFVSKPIKWGMRAIIIIIKHFSSSKWDLCLTDRHNFICLTNKIRLNEPQNCNININVVKLLFYESRLKH